jgi:protein phosphatase PTC2/3
MVSRFCPPSPLSNCPSLLVSPVTNILFPRITAEFRGPGVHHNFDDSDSGYDLEDQKQGKPFGIGGYRGRIIFLGDGTEVLTDSDDTEMFDNSEEDKDLASQVSKSSPPTSQEGGSESAAAGAASSASSQPQQAETKAEESKNGADVEQAKKDAA